MSGIFGNPINGFIYLSPGTVDGHSRWFRSQRFGCTGFSWEPAYGSCDHYHRAIDIARGVAGCDDPLGAAQNGTVIYAGTLNDGAKAVVVRHAGGYATGACHMNSISVVKGQTVTRGQKLGTIGATGHATGCHDHMALKGSFPTWGGVNEFWRDGVGVWLDIWPRLAQNVRDHPKGAGVNIRNTPNGVIYAVSQSDGQIHRKVGNAVIGPTAAWRKWDWTVTGPSITQGGTTSDKYEPMWLDGAFRYIWAPLAVRSVS